MRKQTLKVAVLGFLGLGFGIFAQTTEETQNTKGKVGINTKEPYATLEIKAKGTADGANGIDGFLPPRLTGAELMTMTKKLKDAGDVKGADYDGLIVYVTEAVQDTDLATLTETDDQWVKYAMHKVSMAGYYRYNYITNTGGLDDATATGLGGSFLHRVGSWVRLEPTGLEVIINDNKIGRRLMGSNTANYGPIGRMAVDMSSQIVASTTRGATGDYSLAIGRGTTASGKASLAMGGYGSGSGSTASGEASWTTITANVSGKASFSNGHTMSASNTMGFGQGTISATVKNSLVGGTSHTLTTSSNIIAEGSNGKITNSNNAIIISSKFNKVSYFPELINAPNGIAIAAISARGKGKGAIVMGSITEVNGTNSIAMGQGITVGKFTSTTDIANNSIGIAVGGEILSNNSLAMGNSATYIRKNADNSISLSGEVKKDHSNSIVIGNNAVSAGENQIVIGQTDKDIYLAPLTAEDEVEVDGATYNVAVGEECYKTSGGTATLNLRGKLAYKAGVGLLGCVSTTWVKLGN